MSSLLSSRRINHSDEANWRGTVSPTTNVTTVLRLRRELSLVQRMPYFVASFGARPGETLRGLLRRIVHAQNEQRRDRHDGCEHDAEGAVAGDGDHRSAADGDQP